MTDTDGFWFVEDSDEQSLEAYMDSGVGLGMLVAEEPSYCELSGTGVDSRYLVPLGVIGPAYLDESDTEGWFCFVITYVTGEAPLDEEFYVALDDGLNVLDIQITIREEDYSDYDYYYSDYYYYSYDEDYSYDNDEDYSYDYDEDYSYDYDEDYSYYYESDIVDFNLEDVPVWKDRAEMEESEVYLSLSELMEIDEVKFELTADSYGYGMTEVYATIGQAFYIQMTGAEPDGTCTVFSESLYYGELQLNGLIGPARNDDGDVYCGALV